MKVYIGNLSKEMTEAQFSDMVGAFGDPFKADLVKDRQTGASRGFGFVEYPNDDHARAAITALHGKEVDGRVLKANESQPRGTTLARPESV